MILGQNSDLLIQEVFSENLECARGCFRCKGHKTDKIPPTYRFYFLLGKERLKQTVTSNSDECLEEVSKLMWE